MIKQIKKIISLLKTGVLKENIKFLLRYNLADEFYRAKDEAVEDVIYEFDIDKKILPNIVIKSPDETLDILEMTNKSFCRLGDGEIDIINGKDCPFQKYDERLAHKMLEILSRKKDNLFVGLNGAYFDSPYKYIERNHKFYRQKGTQFRRFFLSVCDLTSIYLDACCFGAYFRYDDNFNYEEHYDRIKKLFENKKITIVCGKTVFDKIEFDIFEKSCEKYFLYAPSINAFSEYDNILNQIKTSVPKEHLVCIILGMTATVLAADLADLGYTAWDLGHIAKDYDCYMKKMEKTEQNMSKFWAPD